MKSGSQGLALHAHGPGSYAQTDSPGTHQDWPILCSRCRGTIRTDFFDCGQRNPQNSTSHCHGALVIEPEFPQSCISLWQTGQPALLSARWGATSGLLSLSAVYSIWQTQCQWNLQHDHNGSLTAQECFISSAMKSNSLLILEQDL